MLGRFSVTAAFYCILFFLFYLLTIITEKLEEKNQPIRVLIFKVQHPTILTLCQMKSHAQYLSKHLVNTKKDRSDSSAVVDSSFPRSHCKNVSFPYGGEKNERREGELER